MVMIVLILSSNTSGLGSYFLVRGLPARTPPRRLLRFGYDGKEK